jgi:hypothetical protein
MAFQGIVTSKNIFATDLRFLNDREFVHARKTTEQVISLNIFVHPIHIRWQMNVDFDAAALSEAFNVPLGRGTKPSFAQATGDGCSASTMLYPREF